MQSIPMTLIAATRGRRWKLSEVCVSEDCAQNQNNNPNPEGNLNANSQAPKDASQKLKHKSRAQKVKKGFYYSFLTLVLLFCLVQVGFGAILNISKTISYRAKINTLEKVRDEAEARNQDLKNDI